MTDADGVLACVFAAVLTLQVDAVLVPKSMLTFLEDFAEKKAANKTAAAKAKGKKGNLTVTEALKAIDGNSTAKKAGKDGEDPASKAAYLTNGTTNDTKKGAAGKDKSAKSAGTAADLAFSVLVGLPLVLAAFLVL